MVFDARIGNARPPPRPLFDFRTFGTSVMKIQSNGNVGIGTAYPTAKLHVAGDIKVAGQILYVAPDEDFLTTSSSRATDSCD